MTQPNQSHRLGILIAAPHPGKTAMYHDMTAEARALVRRGYSSDHILCLHGRVDPEIPAQIVFRRSSNVVISNCRPPAARAFLSIGRQSDAISVMGNDLSSVQHSYVFDPSVPVSSVYSEYNRLPSPR